MDKEVPDSSFVGAANTYHCMCTTFLLATIYQVDALPTRKESKDGAIILPLSRPGTVEADAAALHNVIADRKTIVVRRKDGLEKRTLLRCGRCNLVVGYKLDGSQFEDSAVADSVVYILPGALVSTADMKSGRKPALPLWATTET